MNAPEQPPHGPPARLQGAPSPCINVCRMNAAAGLCEGCLRTLSEITAWGSMPEADRQQLWVQLRRRRAVLEGGLAALTAEQAPHASPGCANAKANAGSPVSRSGPGSRNTGSGR